ncbi:MAG TPA: GDSL-type esterase/lipase family protein [Chitinispirillaceae bacterium]|nr:GDSL-type esterase/lipase family protein [Chitinispirillaceae bacterium]
MNINYCNASDSAFVYSGRVDQSVPGEVSFDWPGIYIRTSFEGTSCKVVLQGRCSYDVTIDEQLHRVITAGEKKDTITIADSLVSGLHTLLIAKRSETNMNICTFYGLVVDKNCKLVRLQIDQSRNIEFIGDSYTAGFANEYQSRECAPEKSDEILLKLTNTNKAFGPVLAKSFKAEYQVNAYSGKGLVRNYNGNDKGMEFPVYYDKLFNSKVTTDTAAPLWNFSSWHPQVVVIGLGLNDFLADPPYADTAQYDAAYTALLQLLREKHPGVKMICCATSVWPTQALIPRVKKIVANEKASGRDDVFYFEYHTENTALYGHPSTEDNKKIARELQPLVAEITKWEFARIE